MKVNESQVEGRGMHKGDRWLCPNPSCGVEIIVLEPSKLREAEKLPCACGAAMKRRYEKPAMAELQTNPSQVPSRL